MTDIQEIKDYCTRVFVMWIFDEQENPNMDYQDKDKEFLEESFITKMLLKKFEVFDIKIHLPVHLLMILSLCTNENPGQVQIILKQLLLSIKKRKGPISENYVITTDDFGMCFQDSFPIMAIPAISESYMLLWDQQKKPRDDSKPWDSDNLCDTVEWWKEVME